MKIPDIVLSRSTLEETLARFSNRLLLESKKSINNIKLDIETVTLNIEQFLDHETPEYIQSRVKVVLENTMKSYMEVERNMSSIERLLADSSKEARDKTMTSTEGSLGESAIDNVNATTLSKNLRKITKGLNNGSNTGSTLSLDGIQTLSNQIVTNQKENKELHVSFQEDIKKIIADKVSTLSYQITKSPKNETLQEEKEYWTYILSELEKGSSYTKFYQKDSHELFTSFYNNFIASHPLVETLKAMNWEETRDEMIVTVKKNLVDNSQADLYWSYLIQKLRNPNIDVIQLFTDHQELFLILQDILQVPELPQAISVYSKAAIYPKLFTNNIYANIGTSAIYDTLRNLKLTKVDGVYQILRELNEVIVSNVGERQRNEDNTLPALLEGQWYAKDRINNPTKPESSFWNAAVYNTQNEKAHLYKTIAQRHAYYAFADNYLKSLGIINEWFDAAARVTIYDPLKGEVALGGASEDSYLSSAYLTIKALSPAVVGFLRGGNEFLLEHNMRNLKLLIEGKGTLDFEFTDANGKRQIFTNLTPKQLDFKLVELEQTLVQQYLLDYLKENKSGPVEEFFERNNIADTPEEDLKEITDEINSNFGGLMAFMSEDKTQDTIAKYFTKDGKLTFDFTKYKDRVQLGQLLVEELYYDRYKNVLTAKLEEIRKRPLDFVEKPTQEPFDKAKKDIPEKDLKIKDYYKKIDEEYIRLIRIKENIDKLIEEYGTDARKYVEEEIKKVKKGIWKKAKDTIIALYVALETYIIELEKDIKRYTKEHINKAKEAIVNPELIIDEVEEYFKEKIEEKQQQKDEAIQHREKQIKETEKTINKGIIVYEQLEDILKNPDKYYKKVIKKIDNTTVNALVKTAIRIYPDLLNIVLDKNSEKIKSSLFKTDYKATVAILLYEFAMGEGVEERKFNYNEHPFADKILEGRVLAEIMKEAIDILERDRYDFEKMPDVIEGTYSLSLGFSPKLDPSYWLESIDKHLNSNLPQFFLGGSTAFFYIEDKKLVGQIYNETSRGSLMLHIGNDRKRGDDVKKISTIKQRIYFTFDLQKK